MIPFEETKNKLGYNGRVCRCLRASSNRLFKQKDLYLTYLVFLHVLRNVTIDKMEIVSHILYHSSSSDS
jgi:hypothetical protein